MGTKLHSKTTHVCIYFAYFLVDSKILWFYLALDAIAKTRSHELYPIPAYDMHRDLIDPTMYCRRLEGAIVKVDFTLTHWSIGVKAKSDQAASDTYGADIVKLSVLVPPKPTVVTPQKRKVSAVDPTLRESLSKRARRR